MYEERLARVESSLDQHGLLLADIQRQLGQIHTQSNSYAGPQSTTSPQSQYFQSLNGATPRAEADDLENVHFLIPEKHCTPTTWLLSHAALRGLLGDYPDRYFHALEKKIGITTDLSGGQDPSQTLLIDIEGQSTLIDSYFSTAHCHYPIFTRLELARTMAESTSLANATMQLVCALGESAARSRLCRRNHDVPLSELRAKINLIGDYLADIAQALQATPTTMQTVDGPLKPRTSNFRPCELLMTTSAAR